jgi:hypothetical protein
MTKGQPATPIANIHAKTRNKPAKKEFTMYARATWPILAHSNVLILAISLEIETDTQQPILDGLLANGS